MITAPNTYAAGPFSVASRVRFAALSVSGIVEWVASSSRWGVGMLDPTGKLFMIAKVGASPNRYQQTTESVQVGRWCDIVATWDGTSFQCFLDGVALTVGGELTGGAPVTSGTVLMGTTTNLSQYGLLGGVEYVAIWDRALQQSEAIRLHVDPWAMLKPARAWPKSLNLLPAFFFRRNVIERGISRCA